MSTDASTARQETMSLSIEQTGRIVEELRTLLDRGRVRKVWAANEMSFILEVRLAGITRYVLTSLEERAVRTHLVPSRPPQPQELPGFVMLLRKYLTGGRIRSVRQVEDDRVVLVDIDVPARSPDGTTAARPGGKFRVLAELTGRHGNVFLLDGNSRILGSLLPNHSFRRKLVSGQKYVFPAVPPAAVTSAAGGDALGLGGVPPDGQRSERLRAFYDERLRRAATARLAHEILRRLRREATAVRRRLESIARDRDRAVEAEKYRRFGELLQSAHGKVARGAVIAKVPDYYAAGTPLVTVPLDAQLDLKGNIARYFRRYRKSRRARPHIEQRLRQASEHNERVARALQEAETLAWRTTAGEAGRLPDGDASTATVDPQKGLEELEQFQREIDRRRLVTVRPTQKTGQRERQRRALPYREYWSETGKKILVGRGGRHNDSLTVRIARGNDLWLHAHDWSGAHVVVRLDRGEEIDQESLLDAATLAAHNSRGKKAEKVEVLYTRAKHVSKPRGFAPGLVSVAKAKTILIRLDGDRLRRVVERPAPAAVDTTSSTSSFDPSQNRDP